MKKLEDMTIAEMREFGLKIENPVPAKLTKKADILAFLSKPDKVKEEEKPKVPTPKQIQDDKDKKAAKVPLNEEEKARMAELETLARSGRSPDIDQMKELRILRMRKTITPLSLVEKRELDELALKAKGNPIDSSNKSGLPDKERLAELNKRSELK